MATILKNTLLEKNETLDIKLQSGSKTFKEVKRKTALTFFDTIETKKGDALKLLFRSINNITTSTFVMINQEANSPFMKVMKNLQFIADNNGIKYDTLGELLDKLQTSKTEFFIKATLDDSNEDHINYNIAPWHIQFSKKSLDFVPKKSKSKKV